MPFTSVQVLGLELSHGEACRVLKEEARAPNRKGFKGALEQQMAGGRISLKQGERPGGILSESPADGPRRGLEAGQCLQRSTNGAAPCLGDFLREAKFVTSSVSSRAGGGGNNDEGEEWRRGFLPVWRGWEGRKEIGRAHV